MRPGAAVPAIFGGTTGPGNFFTSRSAKGNDEQVPQQDQQKRLLNEQDLVRIEKAHPRGLTSAQIINIFQSTGARLSEATFRKYVQLGLLPRSKRVGSKGKHKGSHGIYPCATVRRINVIKRLMASSYTIEEIQRSFANFKQQIDDIEAALDDLFKGFERELGRPQFDRSRSRGLTSDMDQAKKLAEQLIRRVTRIESSFSWPDKELNVASGGALTRMSLRTR